MEEAEKYAGPGPCSMCGKQAEDRCEQLTGPCCHKSLTFEACTSASRAKTRRLTERLDRDKSEYELRQALNPRIQSEGAGLK